MLCYDVTNLVRERRGRSQSLILGPSDTPGDLKGHSGNPTRSSLLIGRFCHPLLNCLALFLHQGTSAYGRSSVTMFSKVRLQTRSTNFSGEKLDVVQKSQCLERNHVAKRVWLPRTNDPTKLATLGTANTRVCYTPVGPSLVLSRAF